MMGRMATRGRTIRAVVLAAGDGGRLGFHTAGVPKPLLQVAGRPLIDYTLGALASAGVREAIVVTGYRREQLEAELRRRTPSGLQITFARNRQYERGVSFSLEAARPWVEAERFLLVMADHLLSGELIARLLRAADLTPSASFVAADATERSLSYTHEATKLAIGPGRRVTAIGKGLLAWSALDTGAFVVSPGAWHAVDAVARDCELGVVFGEVARRGDLYAADVSGAFWYDVDTEEDLLEARQLIGPGIEGETSRPVTLALGGDPAAV
jgi:choline kinase